MGRTTKRWLLGLSATLGVLIVGTIGAGYWASQRLEPFVREKTTQFLSKRFDADVRLESFKVRLSWKSTWEVLLNKGKGADAKVEAGPLVLSLNKYPNLPPLLSLKKLRFTVDLGSLAQETAVVRQIRLEGMDINLPPKQPKPPAAAAPGGKAPPLASPQRAAGKGTEPTGLPPAGDDAEAASAANKKSSAPPVMIDVIEAPGTRLAIHPKDPTRAPLVWELHKLVLRGATAGRPLDYDAELTNAKPPGLIHCKGQFGPWVSKSPSDSPISGDFTFENADLSVFKGIAGILASKGSFQGTLDEIIVDGSTTTPDFRLTHSGNKVPLATEYHAIVNGTNGNTILDPVKARLGSSSFTVKGGVVRNAGEKGKTVDLNANIPAGRIQDFLLLAMKGSTPIMKGGINLTTRVLVPPGKGHIADKLQLQGTFQLIDGRFTSATVQNKLDDLSRRAQGTPTDQGIAEVPVVMSGDFKMGGGRIDFPKLFFSIPGADVDLSGGYIFSNEALDFTGEAKVEARVSQMMVTRWKRWALKPVDPYFAKQGHGTVAKFKVGGTRDDPKFNLKK
ncbi:MAG: hypothetical protein HY821_04595 [Acidobacteria bacterium]|nr:hypothetical protein [Acidobacteriota bacterium]